MSCLNNGHSRCKSESHGSKRRNAPISSANFTSTFVCNTVSKFCPRFINGCHIDVDKNGFGIELRRNWIYLVSYSYTLETEKCGALEITPVLNGECMTNEKSWVANARDGKITASSTFTLETDCFSLLSFEYCASEAETGERPFGQVSIVSLGPSCTCKNNRGTDGSGRRSDECRRRSDGCRRGTDGSGRRSDECRRRTDGCDRGTDEGCRGRERREHREFDEFLVD